jgi:ComF family protein
LWRYDVVSSASVFAYKYNAHREYALFYAEVLIHFYKDWITALGVQQIIPVPISRQKKRKKGFNHAELLAEQLGDALGIPVNHRGLIRIHSTAPQKELGKEERRKNLEKAFRADIKYLPGIQRVLLVDDIYTTGSTIEFCTRALKAVGVKKVWFLTLCIGSAF